MKNGREINRIRVNSCIIHHRHANGCGMRSKWAFLENPVGFFVWKKYYPDTCRTIDPVKPWPGSDDIAVRPYWRPARYKFALCGDNKNKRTTSPRLASGCDSRGKTYRFDRAYQTVIYIDNNFEKAINVWLIPIGILDTVASGKKVFFSTFLRIVNITWS